MNTESIELKSDKLAKRRALPKIKGLKNTASQLQMAGLANAKVSVPLECASLPGKGIEE